MRVLKTVRTRHPKSFDHVTLSVSAHRDVFMLRANGNEPWMDIVTSKVITVGYFRSHIEIEFGECVHFDQYVDYSDGMEVIRGMVVHEGMKKSFKVRFEELTEQMLDDVLWSLRQTTKLETETL